MQLALEELKLAQLDLAHTDASGTLAYPDQLGESQLQAAGSGSLRDIYAEEA